MSEQEPTRESAELAAVFDAMRPRLHRLTARLTGSVVDGEDALQEAYARALVAWSTHPPRDSVEGWLLRIAHRCAIDVTRRRSRAALAVPKEWLDTMPDSTPTGDADSRVAVEAALRCFMFLTPIERSCVVLMDVLDHGLADIVELTGASLPAVKAALHRGRRRLREVADASLEAAPSALDEATRSLLARYAERFNARDFDGVSELLAEEAEVEVVARARLSGRATVRRVYFANYATSDSAWWLVPGRVEGRPALHVHAAAHHRGAPDYFILVERDGPFVVRARDFRHARYVMDARPGLV